MKLFIRLKSNPRYAVNVDGLVKDCYKGFVKPVLIKPVDGIVKLISLADGSEQPYNIAVLIDEIKKLPVSLEHIPAA